MSNTELYEAILKVQQDAPFIDKSAANPFFKSKYADLPAIWKAVKESMGSNGLLVTHSMTAVNDCEYIVTKIIHAKTGQEMESVSKITLSKVTAQEYGSYITYMRRYALIAMLGLVTDEDDDGNKASQAKQADKKADTPKPKTEVKPLSGEEFLMIQNGLKNATLETLESEKAKAKAVWARATKEQRASITKFVADADKRLDDIPHFGGNDE
jgi:hypothetical protein